MNPTTPSSGKSLDPERHASVIQAMHAHNLDLLLCATPASVRLVSGYWPVMGNSVAAVSREGAVYAIVPEDERELAQATTAAECIDYQPHTLERLTTAPEALLEPLQTLAKRLGSRPRNIGISVSDAVEPGSYVAHNRMQNFLQPLVEQAFPNAAFHATKEMLTGLEAVKTPREIAVIRRACERAAAGFAAAPAAIAAGRREDEVAADVQAAYERTANQGFERGFGKFFCMSGPNSVKAAGAYARTRSRVLEQGDLVMIHANTTGDGLWTDLTRTYTVGTPSAEHTRMRTAIDEARSAALEAIAGDVLASRVDQAARDILSNRGFGPAFKHAVGHGVGFAAADANALPRLHPKSSDILAVGMTFNIEPAIYLEGIGGMRHCDVIACGSNGAHILSCF